MKKIKESASTASDTPHAADEPIMNMKLLTKNTAIFLGAVLILILLIFSLSHRGEPLTATVYISGEAVYQTDLNKSSGDNKLDFSGEFPLTVHFGKGYAQVVHSSCPDKICQNAGKLDKNGDMAVCMPNQTVVEISGKTAQTPDAVAQ